MARKSKIIFRRGEKFVRQFSVKKMDLKSKQQINLIAKSSFKSVAPAPLKETIKAQSKIDSRLQNLLNDPETIHFDIFNHRVKRNKNSVKDLEVTTLEALNKEHATHFWPIPQLYKWIYPQLVDNYESYIDWIYDIFVSLDLSVNVLFASIVTWLKALTVLPGSSETNLKILLLTSLYIQSKIDNIQSYPPIETLLHEASISSLNKASFLEYEAAFLNALNFEVNTITFRDYIKLFAKHNRFNATDCYILNYISFLILRNCEYFKYHPSEVAAALIAAEFRISNKPFCWTLSNKIETGFDYEDIKDLSFKIVRQYEREFHLYNVSEEINRASYMTQKNAEGDRNYCSVLPATELRYADYLLNGSKKVILEKEKIERF